MIPLILMAFGGYLLVKNSQTSQTPPIQACNPAPANPPTQIPASTAGSSVAANCGFATTMAQSAAPTAAPATGANPSNTVFNGPTVGQGVISNAKPTSTVYPWIPNDYSSGDIISRPSTLAPKSRPTPAKQYLNSSSLNLNIVNAGTAAGGGSGGGGVPGNFQGGKTYGGFHGEYSSL
jgi:hypothetical protein